MVKRLHVQITLVLLLVPLVFIYNVYLSDTSLFLRPSQKRLISCYFDGSNTLPELNEHEVTDNSIFFMETSCNHKNGVHLTLRQGCAIESAAKLNLNLKVFVLFVAPSFVNNKSRVINSLSALKNVYLRHIDFVKYSHNTPLQEFVASGKMFNSQWPVSHTSDLLRFLTLWKFGGTYMDLDVVLMKSLEGMTNFVSAESNTSIASLVLNFNVDYIGRTIANITIYDFLNNFDGNNWGNNGPGVITRALQTFCNTDVITEMNYEKCHGFTVYGLETFCPISWRDWRQYFDETTSDQVMAKLADSVAIHVWNLHSKHAKISVGSKQPYGLVAAKYCPKIVSLADREF